MMNEITYWIALAQISQMTTRRKNEILSYIYTHDKTIIDIFEAHSELEILSESEIQSIEAAKQGLPNIAFEVEDILHQGYEIIPLNDKVRYPKTLKKNLKMLSPLVLYTKGNIALLNQPTVAIVGSRSANETSLQFTDNICKRLVADNQVVVSGFAKGVDQQALQSALKYQGKSIIVLPQGILGAGSTLRAYFPHISAGKVLVMSFFPPKMPWSKECAMARNPIIYGMAEKIYVAQSDDKGGTWSGVIDGIKKQREIYVRLADDSEKTANMQLIELGAKAVDMEGNIVERNTASIEEQLTDLLSKGEYSLSSIKSILNLDIKDEALRARLSVMDGVQVRKSRTNLYSLRKTQMELF